MLIGSFLDLVSFVPFKLEFYTAYERNFEVLVVEVLSFAESFYSTRRHLVQARIA